MDACKEVVARYWGYQLRPLQEQAIQAVLAGRDSLVVLPTGGGKSLCYQAPAVSRGDTTVVISPLISLMKDQVDGLRAAGVAAAQIDSSLSAQERHSYELDIRQGAVRLLYVAPERLSSNQFFQLLQSISVRTFAIDEAHCISHWGHEFRPDYRQLKRLKEWFPQASVHAYTATATEKVRQDIIDQLGLRNPAVVVGDFDRPNLTYRIVPRGDMLKQVLEVIRRHESEAGIIYCLSRRDVDGLGAELQALGINAQPYHAGLSTEQRRATQEAFANEKCDIVVATVAFGMGIDRSNVRYVLHTTMPKSVEHYQQETGRAGRDSLEAECVLLFSGRDFMSWKSILEKSASEPGVDSSFLPNALKHLKDLENYCRSSVCRHRALVQYFGQQYSAATCGACDICLGDAESVPDALTVAQKILSCVARVGERFGVAHVVAVLQGENTEGVRRRGHEKLSTYGLLRDWTSADVRDWIYQLVGQQVLRQEEVLLASGARAAILKLNEASWEVMRAQRSVRLIQPRRRQKGEAPAKSKAHAVSWEGVDRELFEKLRELRRKVAGELLWQPYLVFSDATLRELARCRPSTLEKMRLVYGVGEQKLRDFGPRFLTAITEYCQQNRVALDIVPKLGPPEQPKKQPRPSPVRDLAFRLFRQQSAIEDVMHQTGRSRGTICEYLAQWIQDERPRSLAPWVSPELYQRIAVVAREIGTARLKPIYIALGEQVPYELIHLVTAHLRAGDSA
jgi:ATP-dependent DNA helicase RecQ